VRERTEELVSARDAMVEQEKMAALGGLVAGVAHEINTPIGVAVTAASGLSNYADMLVESINAPKVSRSELAETTQRLKNGAVLVEQNLARAAELIGNFKQLAVDQNSEHVGLLKLHDYVHGLVSAHSPELRRAGIKAVIEIDGAIEARLAAGRFSQLISNLLMNAVRHAFPNGGPGTVWLRASTGGDAGRRWLQFEVADDGVGLTPEVRERLFEPFFTTKRGQGGSGLGMHIVYTIVHQMGGTVTADLSTPSAPGCTIRMRLPLTL